MILITGLTLDIKMRSALLSDSTCPFVFGSNSRNICELFPDVRACVSLVVFLFPSEVFRAFLHILWSCSIYPSYLFSVHKFDVDGKTLTSVILHNFSKYLNSAQSCCSYWQNMTFINFNLFLPLKKSFVPFIHNLLENIVISWGIWGQCATLLLKQP